MRHLKLYKDGTLTRTQNDNIERVFPREKESEEETFEGITESSDTEPVEEKGSETEPEKPPVPVPDRIVPRYSLRSRNKSK